jgi:hypothetical protein
VFISGEKWYQVVKSGKIVTVVINLKVARKAGVSRYVHG